MKIFDKFKILTLFNAFKSSYSYDDKGDFIFSTGVSGAYGILLKPELKISYHYLLGLLNSSLLDNFIKTISTALRGGFYSYENKYIKQLPIYFPNSNDKDKFEKCKKIEEFVKQILELKNSARKKMLSFWKRRLMYWLKRYIRFNPHYHGIIHEGGIDDNNDFYHVICLKGEVCVHGLISW